MALSIGILVDESTVVIENIHTHIARGKMLFTAIYDASIEVVVPTLLAMLSVISVFMPSFFMVGVTRSLFVPLSMAVGLSMFCSYLLSGTYVPVLCAWILKPGSVAHRPSAEKAKKEFMSRLALGYQRTLIGLHRWKSLILAVFVVGSLTTVIIWPQLGREIFPAGNPTGFQLRLKAPTGTRFEVTEQLTLQVLDLIARNVGQENLQVSISYVGSQPPSYAVSNIYMWTSGPQEAVLLVSLKKSAEIRIKELEERLRVQLKQHFPDVAFTFEAGDIVNKILNFGSATPLQVDVNGPDFNVALESRLA